MNKIPTSETLFLVRALGLLINQASVYGPLHKVTQSAQKSVFVELSKTVAHYTTVDFTCTADQILVNGSSDDLDPATVRNLRDRMALHKLGGLIFSNPLNEHEFQQCIALLASPPGKLDEQGGLENILKTTNFKSIQTLNVNYQRIVGSATPSQSASNAHAENPRTPYSGVVDLSDELALNRASEAEQPSAVHAPAEQHERPRSDAMHEEITALISEVVHLLTQSNFSGDETHQQAMTQSLRAIRDTLRNTTETSQQHISSLADKIHEDRQTIASIESAARRRGLLKLTREELVERYAELNQEIVQPLTVSTGVIDLLNSGQVGLLSDAQRDLLKLAAESVDRVNQLVAYMNRIAGLPETFMPDAGLISETYK